MTIYRSYKKLIITFLFLFLFVMVRYFGFIFMVKTAPIIWITSFIILLAIVFEIQKTKVARSLGLRLFPDIPNHIFIYDNGTVLDPFENFFIVNKDALIICTCHSFMQRKLNELFKKDSDLDVILHSNVSFIRIEPTEGNISIKPNDHPAIEIKKFNYMEEVERLLLDFGYIEVNGTFRYQSESV